MAEPNLSRLALRYTVLRFGIFAAVYVVAAAIMVPLLPDKVALLDAGLVAVVISLPLAARLGRPMRAQLTEAIGAKQQAARVKDAEDAERVEAVRQARAGSTTPDA